MSWSFSPRLLESLAFFLVHLVPHGQQPGSQLRVEIATNKKNLLCCTLSCVFIIFQTYIYKTRQRIYKTVYVLELYL